MIVSAGPARPSRMGNRSTRFVWPAATASVRPPSMNSTPSQVSSRRTFCRCAPLSRSTRSTPLACQPLCVTAARCPSGLTASPSGKSPTLTCFPAGERYQPVGSSTRPLPAGPGTGRDGLAAAASASWTAGATKAPTRNRPASRERVEGRRIEDLRTTVYLQPLHRLHELGDRALGVAEQHRAARLVVELVVDAGEARVHA